MQEIDFVRYLQEVCHLGERTVGSRLANCKRVERYEGDLDEHFENDGLISLIRRLSYSTQDETQSRPAQHAVPISGNVRNGSATLKQAVGLYMRYRLGESGFSEVRRPAPRVESSQRAPGGDWPVWPEPDDVDIFQLAAVITPLVKFLQPSIVQRVVDDNSLNRTGWSAELARLGVDPDAYLWEGSPCAFPGVRRYTGSQEIAQFRGKARSAPDRPDNCLSLDDNDYPKHLWAYVFTGKPFRKRGPKGYQLAHLADHKAHNNRWQEEFAVESATDPPQLFGLYTSPTNLAYVPSNFLKPTDFSGTLRTLLLKKAYQLYGNIARLAPPPLVEKIECNPEWQPDNFEWGACVGSTEHLGDFLQFRAERMLKLIESANRSA